MSTSLSDLILGFIAELRAARIPISVAESIDAMNAVAAAGLAPNRMREALRVSLIKDQADNPRFDEIFSTYFRGPSAAPTQPRPSRGGRIGLVGRGGPGEGPIPPPRRAEPSADSTPVKPHQRESGQIRGDHTSAPEQHHDRDAIAEHASSSATIDGNGEANRTDADAGEEIIEGAEKRHGESGRDSVVEQLPFAEYTPLEYEQAREILGILARRWRVRLGRRLIRQRRGRIDFRRTLRAAIQHGGALIDRQFRARRPRHVDLVVLADVSGSVRYASELFLELLAGAAFAFRRVHRFVYIDRLSSADFEQGHVVMTPAIDYHARSDFGRVLRELRDGRESLLNRATILVILGDARNNRRPARADLLRDITYRCRATIWLNPEPRARWGTGDSAIENYRRVVDFVMPCANLRELEASLAHIA